jgi:hypothetical protein
VVEAMAGRRVQRSACCGNGKTSRPPLGTCPLTSVALLASYRVMAWPRTVLLSGADLACAVVLH